MYARTHAITQARTHVRTHARTHACTNARTHTHTHTHACMHARTHARTHARARTHTHTHTHIDRSSVCVASCFGQLIMPLINVLRLGTTGDRSVSLSICERKINGSLELFYHPQRISRKRVKYLQLACQKEPARSLPLVILVNCSKSSVDSRDIVWGEK